MAVPFIVFQNKEASTFGWFLKEKTALSTSISGTIYILNFWCIAKRRITYCQSNRTDVGDGFTAVAYETVIE